MKQFPLSDTSMPGNPCTENKFRSVSVVVDVFTECAGYTFIHFVCASMMNKNILPRNGLA